MAKKKKEPVEQELLQDVQYGTSPQEAATEQMLDDEMQNVKHDPTESDYGAAGMDEEIKAEFVPVITSKEVEAAEEIRKKYMQGKANLDNRIVENEQWWKLRHWELMASKSGEEDKRIKPVSAWLFNSIANKHADAMDNYPEPNVLPRAQDDEEAAKQLSSIIPVILEQNGFEQTYNDTWWYKLKAGTGCYGIFWDNSKMNGLGDVSIVETDILNLSWQSGIKDIQKSPNLFSIELVDNDLLKAQYPDIKNITNNPAAETAKYIYDDTVDTTEKSAVVDWYYKKQIKYTDQNGIPKTQTVVHYCKYCNGQVLYASENDPNYADRGYYDHGKYPFVLDPLFRVEGSPCGFGYVDVMKDTQGYIDKMQQAILENAIFNARPKIIMRDDGSVNEEELMDSSKAVAHATGNLGEDSFRVLNGNSLSGIYETVLNNKIMELKETSGNNNVSQGVSESGVTAASAIAALQDASGKLSRDSQKSSYRCFAEICYFVIELIRQFYTEPRTFRITGETGAKEFTTFDNANLMPSGMDTIGGNSLGDRVPVFDIEVQPAKRSTYSKKAQNELALQFYNLQFFNPQNADSALSCLDMMDFDGKDKVIDRVRLNGTLYQTVLQLQTQVVQMASAIDNLSGGATNLTNNAIAQAQQTQMLNPNGNTAARSASAMNQTKGSQASQAAEHARDSASPQ